MRISLLPKPLLWVSITVFVFTSCVNDSYLADPKPVADQSFVEEFDTLAATYNRGWRLKNRSVPIGPTNWNQTGDPQFGLSFAPYSATGGVGYIECDNFSMAPPTGSAPTLDGIISNWVISPIVTMQNGDKISFYANSAFANIGVRLQVRINSNNTSLNVGEGTSEGDFDISLLDINPAYDLLPPVGFPTSWTKFTATVYGLNKPVEGRFAFRYFNEYGQTYDPANGTADCVGLDKVEYTSKK
jgi:hypothetical protein